MNNVDKSNRMKVFFHSSLVGKQKYLKEYNLIIDVIQKLNCEVFADHVLKRDSSKLSDASGDDIYRDIQDQKKIIDLCDAVIVETTYPSIGVGYVIAYALENHKNILALYLSRPHAILEAERNRLLTIKKYSLTNEGKLVDDIKSFLRNTQERILKFRFNMMIDKFLNDLLDREAHMLGTSKADYVRKLLYRELAVLK
jgi:hypothetical protein